MGNVRHRHPTIFSVLISEHRTVEALFEQIEALWLTGDAEAQPLFEILRTRLMAHAKAEEAIVYPRFARVRELADRIETAREEHTAVEILLGELTAMAPEHPDFVAKLVELKDDVQRHVDEEEGEIFPTARAEIGEAEAEALADGFLEEISALTGEPASSEIVVDRITVPPRSLL
jgi:hemerythrin superfamily protein